MGNCGDKVQKNYKPPQGAYAQSQISNNQTHRIYLTM